MDGIISPSMSHFNTVHRVTEEATEPLVYLLFAEKGTIGVLWWKMK